MDWKRTFNYGQWVIHSIFTISILVGVGAALFAFRLSNLQKGEESQVLKLNSLIQELRKDNSFEKIGKYLSWAEADKAHDKMRELTGRIAETEEILEIKASPALSQGLRTFNKLINSNSGMSQPTDALRVLNQKVESLQDVAESQKYSQINQIALRMKNRLQSLTAKNVGASVQISYLVTDLKTLQQIISKSTLSEGEKKGLENRVDSMTYEMELLGNLNSQSRNLKGSIKDASLGLGQWLLDVEKRTQNIKGLRDQKQKQLILIICSLVAFLLVSLVGVAYFFRWQKNKISDHLEAEVKNVIEKGIIGDQRYMIDQYSDNTREDIVRLLDELKVKLNLGNLLHEGLPFAGCMIDLNFKVTWYNNLFLDQLYLSEDEVRSDAFNWDYVRDYLNLDQDPIYQAMVNKIAGIYPVKVKQDELTPAQPYEMYVTPIQVNREGRVMVFFYPLVSVKDAINEQVDLTKQTISRFLNLWNEERLDEDELRLLEKDFKGQDIKDLYEDLAKIYERVGLEKSDSLHSINTLEKENNDLNKVVKNLEDVIESKRMVLKEEVKVVNELKDSIISSIDRADSLMHINKTILQQSDDMKNEASRLRQVLNESLKKGKESMEILSQLESAKVDYKKLKFELMEVKVKLISLNNSLLSQLPPLDENQQKLATRYKDELARLDFNVSTLDKKLTQVDVLLTKLNMINEKQPIEQATFAFQTTQKDHEIREAILEIQKHLNISEEKILDQFKSLHTLIREDMKPSAQSKLLDQGESFYS